MQIKHKNNKRVIIIVAVIAALLIGGGVAFAVTKHNQTAKSTKTSSEQKTAKKSSKSKSSTKKSSKKSDDSSSEIASEVAAANNTGSDPTNGGHTPIQYEGQQNADSNNQLSGNISTFSLDGGTLTVRVTFNQIIGGNATCNLTLTGPVGQTYTDTAKVVNDPQSASCYGWDIPASKLGQTSGRWKASVSVTGGDKSGTITGEGNL